MHSICSVLPGYTYKVTVVIRFAAVIAEETKGVVFDNMLGVVLHEFLHTVPQSWDGLDVFVQTENKTVLLALLMHDSERIVVDIAEDLDTGLDTPIVVVVHHERLAEKEARLESAHVTVADRITIDDLTFPHVLAHLLRLLLVDVGREGPVLLRNLAIMRLARDQGCRDLFESCVEGFVIEEHPVVVVATVEAVLDLADRARDIPNVRVTSQSNKGSIHAWPGCNAGKICPLRRAARLCCEAADTQIAGRIR